MRNANRAVGHKTAAGRRGPASREAVSQDRLLRIALGVCEVIDTPVALGSYLRLKYREYDQYVQDDLKPSDYLTAASYQSDVQSREIVTKSPILPTSFDRKAAALAKFYEAEATCKETNDAFEAYWRSGSFRGDPALHDLLWIMSRKINDILGPCPGLADLKGKHGSGSTSSLTGRDVTIGHKLSEFRPSCTVALAKRKDFISAVGQYPSWVEALYEVSPISGPFTPLRSLGLALHNYNRFVTVPKDGKSDRGICIEPTMNVFFQLGVGRHIRDRLRSTRGINLDNQADINRRRARIGSRDGNYATIDLRNASDTVAGNLVLDLFGDAWCELLFDLRSPFTKIGDKEIVALEKFSSMGNGYTFEIETLIFLAMAEAVAEQNGYRFKGPWEECVTGGYTCSRDIIAVFGDDIIVPTHLAEPMLKALAALGFTPNPKKTFITGVFRESCGHDYFDGVFVRPIRLKDERYDSVETLFRLANRLRVCAFRFADHGLCDDRFRPLWNRVLHWLSPSNRLFGPYGLGDAVVWCPRGEAKGYRSEVSKPLVLHEGWVSKVWTWQLRPYRLRAAQFAARVHMALALYGAGRDIPVRDAKLGTYEKASTNIVFWDDVGTWA